MCVIMLITEKDKRPTDIMLEKAWLQNPDLGGVAWRERDKKGKVVVRWQKGLQEKEWAEQVRTLPTPFVAHARIASADGGGVSEELCHPFPVDEGISLALEGTSSRGVLFHNGNWKEWAPEIRLALYNNRNGAQLPPGRMNDTRAMAFMTHLYGDSFMELLPTQRGILFRPDGWEIFTGPGWKELNGVWCSNDLFIHKQKPAAQTPGPVQQHFGGIAKNFCLVASCSRRDTDASGFCPLHTLPTPGQNNRTPLVVLAADITGTPEVSSAQPTPFRQAAVKILWDFTLTQAHFAAGKMSKNLFKQVEMAHSWANDTTDIKRQAKGVRILRSLCESEHLEERMQA
jgi:hypothetical protein